MLDCASTIDWSPGIGDPGKLGWITVIGYLTSAVLAIAVVWLSSRSRHGPAYRRQRFFWFLLAIVLLALALNKQLDLQLLMTEIGRCVARTEGWYDQRRGVQQAFITATIIGLAAGTFIMMLVLIGLRIQNYLAVLGVAAVLFFILLRAATDFHVDALIRLTGMIKSRDWMIELGGIGLILVSALLLLAQREREEDGGPGDPPA